VSIALGFISPSLPWALAIGLILVALLSYARVLVRFVPVAFGILLPIVILLLLVQGLANPANRTVILALGPFSLYEEGIAAGLFTAARIFDLISATFLFSFTTRPADFSEALLQRGLSPRFGYVIQSALQIVPESLEQANRIRDAQQARGLETRGPLSRRVRAYIPLLLPLVLSSLVATQERAMALEVRGFGLPVHRYSRILLPDSPGQRIFRWGLVLLIPLAVAGRFLGWR
jgi:energy-coupling factor transport system permease protein